MENKKIIETLLKRKQLLKKERENHLSSARSLDILGLHSVADNDRYKAHSLYCRICEIDDVISLLEK